MGSKVGQGLMMILSPAKTLDLSPFHGSLSTSLPSCDVTKTQHIVHVMKSRSEKELTKLLGISASLGKTAASYWQNFDVNNSKPSIYTFTGVAYKGLRIEECSDDAVLYLQENLRIIDPLYGSLRPLDRIQPYRLEMATKAVFPDDKKLKLQDFWKESVTKSLTEDLMKRNDRILLNLASDEYSSALDATLLPKGTCFVKVIFQEKGRVVAVHAKRARGLMARFLAENNCQSLDEVKKFNYEGYSFSLSKSDDLCLVFDRIKEVIKRQKETTSSSSPSSKKPKK
jgi:cytoplasmic iron level regulating protein YaaA (DUF328/UPF0246 family)